jgi:hypothetical protein
LVLTAVAAPGTYRVIATSAAAVSPKAARTIKSM